MTYNLARLEDLESDIRRYAWSERARFMSDLRDDLFNGRMDGQRHFFVVKPVPLVQRRQLPNFVVQGDSDLARLPEFLNRSTGSCIEIWYCHTRVDEKLLSVAGRVRFDAGAADHSQVIEQVSRCSPRTLETLSNAFHWPYVRAARFSWGHHFAIEDVRVPSGGAVTRSQILAEFEYAVRRWERGRERIEIFCEILDALNFASYSLEYKVVGEHFSIIDWDTPDDLLVLRKLGWFPASSA